MTDDKGRHMRYLPILALLLALTAMPAGAVGATWSVDRASDSVTDGSVAARAGSLRFVLGHVAAGDIVRFGDLGADSIFVGSTLEVPTGVAVGRRRDEPCGQAERPLVNLLALPGLSGPTISLGAGATLRNVAVANAAGAGGPTLAVKIVGADVDVCAVSFGAGYDPEGAPLEVAAPAVALGIDGAGARVHRSRVKGAISISPLGDDTVIGDALGEAGEANLAMERKAITVGSSATDAARRVTIRDPFPRTLQGMSGAGVPGGDDDPTHANHWALTPSITSATSADGFTTVQLCGTASPLAAVDLFVDWQGVVSRAGSARAGTDGRFGYSGPLPGPAARLLAVATLDDPAHPGRVGSSSQLSASVGVQSGQGGPCAGPAPEPLLAATGVAVNLSTPGAAGAQPGDRLRLTVQLTNTGQVNAEQVASHALQLSARVFAVRNTATLVGGHGFLADEGGFVGGVLGPGEAATYTLEATVMAPIRAGAVVFSGFVVARQVVSIPVVGRLRAQADPGGAPPRRVWLPQLEA